MAAIPFLISWLVAPSSQRGKDDEACSPRTLSLKTFISEPFLPTLYHKVCILYYTVMQGAFQPVSTAYHYLSTKRKSGNTLSCFEVHSEFTLKKSSVVTILFYYISRDSIITL